MWSAYAGRRMPLLRTSPAVLRAVNAPRLNPRKKSSSPGLVVLDEEAVAVADVARQPEPEAAAANALQAPRADAGLVVQKLLRAVAVLARDGQCDLGDVGRSGDVVSDLVGPVPGAVAADNQSLPHARCLPQGDRSRAPLVQTRLSGLG